MARGSVGAGAVVLDERGQGAPSTEGKSERLGFKEMLSYL